MKLYNTLTRKKQAFRPLKKGAVSLYTCGPTVYNFAHIGNLRSYLFADTLERSLAFAGYKVKRVMNITDVGHLTSDADIGEDKLEKEAARSKRTVWDVAEFYAKAFFKDCAELNIKKPHTVVKATDTVKDQIKLIQQLFKKGYAYETRQAVYFDIAKFKKYGALSGQSLEEKLIRARSEVVGDPEKKRPADFALWFKRVGRHKDHAMRWKSPWGEGFPGWHIECSAISSKYLGQPFDIHTGGIDHIGTHHANEIAQSEAAYGKPLAKVWMHNEYLVIDKAKMSKSAGMFITLSDVKERGFEPLSLRYLALTAHYRSQLSFSWESLEAAQKAYDNLLDMVADVLSQKRARSGSSLVFDSKYRAFINDDLNTPKALALLWDVMKSSSLGAENKRELAISFDRVLGLDLFKRARKVLEGRNKIPSHIFGQAQRRWKLREQGEYDEADAIRLRLAKQGYEIQDKDDSFTIKSIKNQ